MARESIYLGIIITFVGIWLSTKVILSQTTPLFVLIYTVIIILVGIGIIAFHKEEDKIEQRKDIKIQKHKL